jgi:hypothetical protein
VQTAALQISTSSAGDVPRTHAPTTTQTASTANAAPPQNSRLVVIVISTLYQIPRQMRRACIE